MKYELLKQKFWFVDDDRLDREHIFTVRKAVFKVKYMDVGGFNRKIVFDDRGEFCGWAGNPCVCSSEAMIRMVEIIDDVLSKFKKKFNVRRG